MSELPTDEQELLLKKQLLVDFEQAIQQRKQNKKYLSDAIKNSGDRIRAEFELLHQNDPEIRQYVEEFNSLMQDVIEEYALSISEDIDFMDTSKMKRTIDVSDTRLKQHKQQRKDKDLDKRTKLEDVIRAQLAKIH